MKKLLFIGILAFSLTTHSQITSIVNGLEAEYTFNNGNATADFGGIDGSAYNVVSVMDRFGCPNRAYEFEIMNQSSISLGDNFDNIISAADSSWSISMWFKLDNLNNDYAPLINKYAHIGCDSDQREFILRLSANNEMEFYFGSSLSGSSYAIVRGATIINDTKWHHVVLNYDGSDNSTSGLTRVEIYLDNILETTYLAANSGSLGDIQNGTAHLGIGARLDSYGNYCPIAGQNHLWDGKLDDIRLYSRELNNNEIDTLFTEHVPCTAGLSKNELTDLNFKIYPNPATNYLNVEINNISMHMLFDITIKDILGRKVKHIPKSTGNESINISNLPPSTYIVEIKNNFTLIAKQYIKY